MHTTGIDDRRIARLGLLGLAAMGTCGAALVVIHRQWGIGLPCPFLSLTGWWCPFCGGTRMVGSLIDGDLAAAVHWNPVALILVIGTVIQGVIWVMRLIKPAPRSAGSPHSRRGPSARVAILSVSALLLAWTIARNVFAS